MTVVSNTTPLNYLILIKHVEILSLLYGKISIPRAVFQELTAVGTPAIVRAWMRSAPVWLEVASVALPPDASLQGLHAGEREAILLAEHFGAGALIIDDRDGRQEAIRRGLRVTGTLGALDEAAERGLIDLAEALTRLGQTSFRASPALLQSFFDRYALRRLDG